MKQCLLIAMIFYTYHASSQQAYQLLETDHPHEIGFYFMPVFSVWDTRTPEGEKVYGDPKLGYGLSLAYVSVLNRYFSIQSGFIYHSMNYNLYLEKNKVCTVHLDNFHVPVLFTLNTDKTRILNYTLFAGPQIGWNISSSVKYPATFNPNNNRTSTETVLCVNKFDTGLAYGAGADIALSASRRLRLDFGYIGTYGFADRCGAVESYDQSNVVDDNTTISTFGDMPV